MRIGYYLSLTLLLGLSSCQDRPELPPTGSVELDIMNSQILGRSVEINRYFPPGYGEQARTYPLIVLLHGHGGDHMDWIQQEEGNVQMVLDSLIDHKRIPPVLAVTANAGNSWYVNAEEPMQDFFLNEWIPALKKEYQDRWDGTIILAGDSAGGYGSLRFALVQPETFDAVVLLSPAAYYPTPPEISSSRKIPVFAKDGAFNDSIWKAYAYPRLLEELPVTSQLPVFYLSVGDDDPYNIVPVVTALQQEFLQRGVTNELRITDGAHDWECWKYNFADALTMILGD